MTTLRLLAPLPVLLVACQSPAPTAATTSPWPGEIQRWGTLREALRDGQVEARVAVADLAAENVWAVGALEGLEGEITIADGEVWITRGDPQSPVTTRGGTPEANATVLFAAEVADWLELPVEESVDPSVLDAYIASQALAAGLDPSKPFPFVVEGGLEQLHMHVLAGECPIRAEMMGTEMTSPPYELHTASTAGRLVGVYAADSAGILCHMGSQSHVHALLDGDPALTGHAETVGLAAGATLKIPRP